MKPFGKYQLIRRIGMGGMAEVYLATGPNPRGDELLAIKLILPHIAEDQSFQEMFLKEARLTAPLTHPNLVQVFDLGMDDGRLYLAMEYIRGHSLYEVIKRARDTRKPVDPDLAAAAVYQACLGLHYVHEAHDATGEPLGLVHRDVSPQNLILGDSGVVKVVDFGLAKATGQSMVSRAGALKGKVGFMPPEQLKSKPLDRRVDVFALGVVLFELATGERLFTGGTDVETMNQILFEHAPDLRARGLHESLIAITTRATDGNRDQRYESAASMATALADGRGLELTRSQGQLAELMRGLFPRSPKTLAEAEGEVDPTVRNRGPLQQTEAMEALDSRPSQQPTEPPSPLTAALPPPPSPKPTLPKLRSATAGQDPKSPKKGYPASTAGSLEGPTDRALPMAFEMATRPDFVRPTLPTLLPPATSDHDLPPVTVKGTTLRRGRVTLIAVAAGAVAAVAVEGALSLRWQASAVLPSASPPETSLSASLDAGLALGLVAEPRPPAPQAEVARGSEPSEEPASPRERPPWSALGLRKQGTITVVTIPWSTVTIDGHELGATPLVEYALPVGKHRVLLRNEEEDLSKETAVVIARGRNTELRTKLR